MTDRHSLIDNFLDSAGWATAMRAPLAGDASNRSYKRLTRSDGQRAVLMDAPPGSGEDAAAFCRISGLLRGAGLSAPDIFAQDDAHGLLLIEDFGDALFVRVIAGDPAAEHGLYSEATDLLHRLPAISVPGLTHYSPALMAQMTDIAFTCYRQSITGEDSTEHAARFEDRFKEILRQTTRTEPVLALRDYHAENLIWLPDRSGLARVGLLDFQDAVLTHPAYDLVSLLQDIRRDVPAGLEAAMLNRYLARSDIDEHGFRTAYAVLGVQRHLRILGVFARLCTNFGKAHYVDFLPRVWDHLVRGLEHPALAPIAEQLLIDLPEPNPAALRTLKETCPKPPTP